MLKNGRSATRIPCQNLARAREFYADKLGLEPSEERPGGLLYRCASGEFALFQSAGASPGTFTQMGWEVDDIDATVAELRKQGRKGRAGRLVSRQRGQHARHRPGSVARRRQEPEDSGTRYTSLSHGGGMAKE